MKRDIANTMHTLLSKLGLSPVRGRERTGLADPDAALMTTELAAVLCVMLGFDGRPSAARPRSSSPPSVPGAH